MIDHENGCPRCGQMNVLFVGTVCDQCRAAERAAQGEQYALFIPAPAPMAGELTL